MTTLWTVLALVAGLHAPEQASLDLRAMVQRAPIIVLARVADPRLDARQLPSLTRNHGPLKRQRRHLEVVSILRGPLRGQKLPQHLRVDQARSPHGQNVAAERYRGELTREPNPGQTVVAFLRPNGRGAYELAADSALDRGEREAEVRALLRGGVVQRGGRAR